MVRAALVQLCSGDDPEANLATTLSLLDEARGADLILTPEVTNCVSGSRARQADMLRTEGEDPTLAAVRDWAAKAGTPVLIGSLALKAVGDPRFVNRSLLIGADGAVIARYDKIHMFDADPAAGESYRESAGFRPGARAVLAEAAGLRVGLTICYDLRFAALYRRLAQSGAEVLTVPSAFSRPTGAAHWETLLRARAIETGCWVLAPAQTGRHPTSTDRARETWGHSLAVAPWGEVALDMGEAPGVGFVDVDPIAVTEARRRVPSLSHDRDWQGP